MILSVIGFLATSMIDIAHAESVCDSSSDICATQDFVSSNTQDNDSHKGDCDINCNGCHIHCHSHVTAVKSTDFAAPYSFKEDHITRKNLLYIPDFIYGLKRPPKA